MQETPQPGDSFVPTPSNPWMAQMVRIRSIKHEVEAIATYEIAFEDAAFADAYAFSPGQFNMLYLPGFGEAAISISSDPQSPRTLGHTVRVAGNVTQELARQQPGDQFAVRGPFGSAWPLEKCRGQNIVIACGGIGLAPLRPVIYQILHQRDDFQRVILLYGARTPLELLYTDEYDAWRAANIEIEVTVDRGDTDWHGHIGVVPALFYRLRLNPAETRVMTCGPEIMMRFVVFEALARRIKPDDIYVSLERNMQCAIGFCGHCQLGPAFVCKNGPVFTYEQMEPYFGLDDL